MMASPKEGAAWRVSLAVKLGAKKDLERSMAARRLMRARSASSATYAAWAQGQLGATGSVEERAVETGRSDGMMSKRIPQTVRPM